MRADTHDERFHHTNQSAVPRESHPAGDSLLARLAGHLREATAGHGHAYRLGGDEFCVVWREADARLPQVEAATAAACEHCAGSQFDPEIVAALEAVLEQAPAPEREDAPAETQTTVV